MSASAQATDCRDEVVRLRGDWGQARFTVEVADTGSERAQGLMFRESMSVSSGMLFVYERPQSVAFWMKNTLIPLDMIFMDSNGTVTAIHENAIPGDLTPIPGGDGVLLVLEINGGLIRDMGISVGSEMQHPSVVEKNAAWGC
ncbi:MAG: DUF192 domain-containing protein [Pseudoruegeria sp.]